MDIVAPPPRLARAFAVHCGGYGDVQRLARQRGVCCRLRRNAGAARVRNRSGTPHLNAARRAEPPTAPTPACHPAFYAGPVRVSPSTRERVLPKTRNTDRKRIIKVVFAETVGMLTLPLASASTESKATGR
jgi:hypothetical protein